MAQTSVGFAGTVNDAEWAVLSSFLGNQACVSSQASLAVTPVGGARSVSVAAGVAYGDGVQTTLSASETVALTTPTNGQWYLIVLRRVWATKVSSLVAIPHTTTSTALPTVIPTSYPAAMLAAPGTQADQPLAWAWCNSANTTVITSDLRQQPIRTIIQQPNPVINGGFDIWQRGTSFSAFTGTNVFGPDRFYAYRAGLATGLTVSRQAAGLTGFQYCARVQRDSGNTSTANAQLLHDIETVNSIRFAGKTVTFSFYARAGANFSAASIVASLLYGTGTDQALRNGYTGQTAAVDQTAALSTVWKQFSFSAVIPTTATQLGIYFSTGFAGTAGAADYFEVTGIQIEEGAVQTPFRRNGSSIQGELAACQRYYQRVLSEGAFGKLAVGWAYTTSSATMWQDFKVSMRTSPTSIDYSNVAIADNINSLPAVGNVSLTTALSNSNTGNVTVTSSSLVQFRPYWLAGSASGTAYLGFSAEI